MLQYSSFFSSCTLYTHEPSHGQLSVFSAVAVRRIMFGHSQASSQACAMTTTTTTVRTRGGMCTEQIELLIQIHTLTRSARLAKVKNYTLSLSIASVQLHQWAFCFVKSSRIFVKRKNSIFAIRPSDCSVWFDSIFSLWKRKVRTFFEKFICSSIKWCRFDAIQRREKSKKQTTVRHR